MYFPFLDYDSFRTVGTEVAEGLVNNMLGNETLIPILAAAKVNDFVVCTILRIINLVLLSEKLCVFTCNYV